jgi:hypothetical protein
VIASLRDRLTPPLDALRQIAANPGLLRLELGSLTFSAADGMVVIGLAVLAYEEAARPAVAVLAIIRALPSVVLVPYLLARTNTMARDALLRLVVGARVVCLVAITALVVADASLALIFLLAAVDSVAGGLLRPLRSTLTPALARSTEELVAANVASTTGDALAAILGPGGAALVLALGDVPATVAAGTAIMGLALVIVVPIHAAPDIDRRVSVAGGQARPSRRGSVLQPVRDLLAMPYARLIVLLFAGQRFVRGVINVALVAAAVRTVADRRLWRRGADVGDRLGGLLGGAVALGLVGQPRLAPAFVPGVIAWGAGILAAGIVPNLVPRRRGARGRRDRQDGARHAGFTLLQRTVPNDQRSNVFGLLEAVISAALCGWSVAAPC